MESLSHEGRQRLLTRRGLIALISVAIALNGCTRLDQSNQGPAEDQLPTQPSTITAQEPPSTQSTIPNTEETGGAQLILNYHPTNSDTGNTLLLDERSLMLACNRTANETKPTGAVIMTQDGPRCAPEAGSVSFVTTQQETAELDELQPPITAQLKEAVGGSNFCSYQLPDYSCQGLSTP